MEAAVIEVRGLTRRFGSVLAVDSLDFSVGRGETCALLGANGAGKTTTLSMLLGLLIPDSGSIHVLGADMVQDRYQVLGRMNFSSPYVDLPQRLTVRENLSVYAHLYGVHDVASRLERLAGELDMESFLERAYRHLSAGQKTRVALAKAMLNEPELLLLDEPTVSLDPDSADYIRSYLEDFQRRTGATLVLASHNMPEVERMCSQVLMMRSGRIVDQGTPAALINRYGRHTMEEVFLDIARERSAAGGGGA